MQKLSDPVKDFVPKLYPAGDVTQWFGENKELYSKAVCYPDGKGGQMCLQGHNGIDIVRAHGTPIMCVMGGKVVETLNKETGFGSNVRVLADDGYEYTYAHLYKIICTMGDRIEKGDAIGLMGNTGFVVSGPTPYWKNNPYAGTHLHLGRRKVTPYSGTGTWTVSYATGDRGTIDNYDNGFFGAVAITADDFEGQVVPSPNLPPEPLPPTTQGSLTVQSLLNTANQLEAQGKLSQAKIVRAVAGFIAAFGF